MLALAYDDAGNLTSDGYREYHWDANNRPSSVAVNESATAIDAVPGTYEYGYDVLGRRIRAEEYDPSVSSVVTRVFLYDGWRVMEERVVDESSSPSEPATCLTVSTSGGRTTWTNS